MSISRKLSLHLQGIAERLDDLLQAIAGKPLAFVLLIQADNVAQYVSNTSREDGKDLVLSLLNRWKAGGADIPAHYNLDLSTSPWKTMDTAPKDRPILAWCVHDADPYVQADGRLTTYAAHAEALTHVADGQHLVEWGGSWEEHDWENPSANASVPDWWFEAGSDFERVANPVLWMEVHDPKPHQLPE